MKVGLVLEGGGMRALFTAGVLDALLDIKELDIDGIVGVSAGALLGVNYVSGQKERAIRYNKKYARDKRYMGFYSWITTGNAVNEEFAFYEIPFKLDVFDQEKFKQSKIDFYVVMTNVESGKPEYVLIKDVFKQMEYLRATSALPFASKIIEINGKKYFRLCDCWFWSIRFYGCDLCSESGFETRIIYRNATRRTIDNNDRCG